MHLIAIGLKQRQDVPILWSDSLQLYEYTNICLYTIMIS